MRDHFKKEMLKLLVDMKREVHKKGSREQKEANYRRKLLVNIDDAFRDQIISRYLQRCDHIYAKRFFEWRKRRRPEHAEVLDELVSKHNDRAVDYDASMLVKSNWK